MRYWLISRCRRPKALRPYNTDKRSLIYFLVFSVLVISITSSFASAPIRGGGRGGWRGRVDGRNNNTDGGNRESTFTRGTRWKNDEWIGRWRNPSVVWKLVIRRGIGGKMSRRVYRKIHVAKNRKNRRWPGFPRTCDHFPSSPKLDQFHRNKSVVIHQTLRETIIKRKQPYGERWKAITKIQEAKTKRRRRRRKEKQACFSLTGRVRQSSEE